MDEHGALSDIAPRPIRTAMALSLRESDKLGPVSSGFLEAMDGKYATHFYRSTSLVSESTGNLTVTRAKFCMAYLVTLMGDKIRDMISPVRTTTCLNLNKDRVICRAVAYSPPPIRLGVQGRDGREHCVVPGLG